MRLLETLAFSGYRLRRRRGRLAESLWAMQVSEGAYQRAGNRYGLQASYATQALILQDWGRLSRIRRRSYGRRPKLFSSESCADGGADA